MPQRFRGRTPHAAPLNELAPESEGAPFARQGVLRLGGLEVPGAVARDAVRRSSRVRGGAHSGAAVKVPQWSHWLWLYFDWLSKSTKPVQNRMDYVHGCLVGGRPTSKCIPH